MKSLIKNILKSNFFILLRNTLKIKPVRISKYYLNKNISMSDSFLFRTDNFFKTIFRFSDIPRIFYDYQNTYIELFFYDYKNVLIKKIEIKNLKKLNELIIDKSFLDGKETYGHFYAFHNLNKEKIGNISISNRCYLGFSRKNNNYSFVHGNLFVKARDLVSGNISSDFARTSLIANSRYNVQQNFSNFDKVELFFSNPTSKKIIFYLNKKKYFLENNSDLRIDLKNLDKVDILSNCLSLRPIIFTYKNNFYDVHHA